MVKLVDTPDLGSGAVRCVGSSPILGIFKGHFSERKVSFAVLKSRRHFLDAFF